MTDAETAEVAHLVATSNDLPLLDRLEDVVNLQRSLGELYVRYSAGPQDDSPEEREDKESGCRLPGLGTNPDHAGAVVEPTGGGVGGPAAVPVRPPQRAARARGAAAELDRRQHWVRHGG